MKTLALGSMLTVAVLGAGCGGGGSSTAIPAKTTGTTPSSMSVAFKIVVPSVAPGALRRSPRYVSASTKSASITVAPAGGSAGSPVTVNCTTVCTGQIASPVGSDTFAVTLYDGLNGTGNLLSTGSLTQTIVQNQANSVNVTLDGVVASLSVGLNPSMVAIGTAATVAVTVNALDADGNTIIGPGSYVNAAGAALTVNLADSDTSGATHLSQASLSAPASGITLSYNGAAISNPTVAASATGLTAGQATLTVNGGTGTYTQFTSGITLPPYDITAGPDGALWFTAFTEIGRITTSGAVTMYSAGISASPGLTSPQGITVGPDGALWFTENSGRVARITTSGAVTEYSSGITSGASPDGIAAGSDGALWFTEVSLGRIGRITTSGTVTEYSGLTGNSPEPAGIAAGSDNNLWFTEFAAGRIGRITTGGVITEYALPSPGSGPEAIAAGPDGALWFTELYGNAIGRITTSGSITEFATGITAGAQPQNIAAGPGQTLWFTERQSAAGQRVAQITTAGVITEYVTSGVGGAEGITLGPDGGMWFAEPGANAIGRIQP